MRSVYERENLLFTEFDTEDVIVTFGETPTEAEATVLLTRVDNSYEDHGTFEIASLSSWF